MKNGNNTSTWTEEKKECIVEFFDLLLKIDKRNNPEKYRKNSCMNTVAYVYLRFDGTKKPFLRVDEGKDRNGLYQVMIYFLFSKDGEHVSLHSKPDESIVRTHWSSNKSRSTWDNKRIEAARANKYVSPDKHTNYFVNGKMVCIDGSGHHICGRAVDFECCNTTDKEKYKEYTRIICDLPQKKCMMDLFLRKQFNEQTSFANSSIETVLGNLIVQFGDFK